MPYEFFFSYTRANNDQYLKLFFEDLSQAVRDKRGLPTTTQVGFFDQQEIELGEEWEQSITDALQTSKVLVSIYSPAYFNSLYCGKEWQVFQLRREAYADVLRSGGTVGVTLAPVIKPVLWIAPLPSALAPAVAATQYQRGDPQAKHNLKGIKYILKQLASYQQEYLDYIDGLADEIIAAADAHPLPSVQLPSLKDVPSAHHPPPPPPQPGVVAPAPLPPAIGPKHVRFVVVAADPNQFGAVRSSAPYLDNGGCDWKPFYPDQKKVGPLVQRIVADDELGFTSDFLTFDQDLQQQIDLAWAEKKIIVLLVDSWTVDWNPQYQAILHQFDSRNYLHCSVLVPSGDDPELALRRADIEQTMRNTFFHHATGNPIFYRDRIGSADDLRTVLHDVLTRIKGEIRNRAVVVRPVPNNIAKPLVNGPGA